MVVVTVVTVASGESSINDAGDDAKFVIWKLVDSDATLT